MRIVPLVSLALLKLPIREEKLGVLLILTEALKWRRDRRQLWRAEAQIDVCYWVNPDVTRICRFVAAAPTNSSGKSVQAQSFLIAFFLATMSLIR
jgi:hypothetical protein